MNLFNLKVFELEGADWYLDLTFSIPSLENREKAGTGPRSCFNPGNLNEKFIDYQSIFNIVDSVDETFKNFDKNSEYLSDSSYSY